MQMYKVAGYMVFYNDNVNSSIIVLFFRSNAGTRRWTEMNLKDVFTLPTNQLGSKLVIETWDLSFCVCISNVPAWLVKIFILFKKPKRRPTELHNI